MHDRGVRRGCRSSLRSQGGSLRPCNAQPVWLVSPVSDVGGDNVSLSFPRPTPTDGEVSADRRWVIALAT
jgi:hypothetical protein